MYKYLRLTSLSFVIACIFYIDYFSLHVVENKSFWQYLNKLVPKYIGLKKQIKIVGSLIRIELRIALTQFQF